MLQNNVFYIELKKYKMKVSLKRSWLTTIRRISREFIVMLLAFLFTFVSHFSYLLLFLLTHTALFSWECWDSAPILPVHVCSASSTNFSSNYQDLKKRAIGRLGKRFYGELVSIYTRRMHSNFNLIDPRRLCLLSKWNPFNSHCINVTAVFCANTPLNNIYTATCSSRTAPFELLPNPRFSYSSEAVLFLTSGRVEGSESVRSKVVVTLSGV